MRHDHVLVHGAGQGVGYRSATRTAAVRAGVAGWVRNRTDGTVEAELHGDAARVQRVLDAMAQGTPAAHVSRIDTDDGPGSGPLGFEIRADA